MLVSTSEAFCGGVSVAVGGVPQINDERVVPLNRLLLLLLLLLHHALLARAGASSACLSVFPTHTHTPKGPSPLRQVVLHFALLDQVQHLARRRVGLGRDHLRQRFLGAGEVHGMEGARVRGGAWNGGGQGERGGRAR